MTWLSRTRFDEIYEAVVGVLSRLEVDGVECKSKSISKDTYTMISALHELRNRKEHAAGQPISESVAIATVMMCLALLEGLAKELASAHT